MLIRENKTNFYFKYKDKVVTIPKTVCKRSTKYFATDTEFESYEDRDRSMDLLHDLPIRTFLIFLFNHPDYLEFYSETNTEYPTLILNEGWEYSKEVKAYGLLTGEYPHGIPEGAEIITYFWGGRGVEKAFKDIKKGN